VGKEVRDKQDSDSLTTAIELFFRDHTENGPVSEETGPFEKQRQEVK